MKTLFILLICFISWNETLSQPSTIFTKSDTASVNIQASSENVLYTSGGSVSYDDVSKIIFHGTPSESVLAKLKYRDITYAFEEKEIAKFNSFKGSSVPQNELSDKDIYLHLSKFNKTRRTGKWLQVFGLIGSGIALALEKEKIALAGTGLALIGFGVDISAGKHLEVFENQRYLK